MFPRAAERHLWAGRAFTLIAVLSIIRLGVLLFSGIANGEAYYEMWSRFPAWSYYDHPPLLAWITWAVTQISAAPAAVRATAVVCSVFSQILLYRLASRMFNPRTGFLAVLLLATIPAFFFSAFILNPEAPLLPLWLGFLLALNGMRGRDEAWRPLALGAVIGLAFLAKYTGVLGVVSTAIYLAWSPSGRRWLTRPSLYMGGLVALALAIPVIAWNYQNGWPTINLHFVERAAPLTLAIAAANVVKIIGGQWGAFHPLLFPAMVAMIGVSYRLSKTDDRYRMLVATSVPLLLFFFLAMIRVRDSESHWTMVAFIPLIIALAAFWDRTSAKPSVRRFFAVAVGAAAIAYSFAMAHFVTPKLVPLIPARLYDANQDVANELTDWPRIGSIIARHAAERPGVVIASTQYALCAKIMFEMNDAPNIYCPTERRSQFDFIGRHDIPASAPVLFVNDSHYPDTPEMRLPNRRCTPSETISVDRGGVHVRDYNLYDCSPASPALR